MKIKKIIGSLGVAIASLGLFASTSFAATSTTTQATVVVNGGQRTITADSTVTLPAVPLSGSEQTTSIPLNNVNVTDASGTGDGWHVTLSAPQVVAGSKTLPSGSLEIDPVNGVAKVDPTSNNVPKVTATTTEAVDKGAVTLMSAPVGDGMGSFTADMSNLKLTIPADTYAGTYIANLTYSLVTAP